MIIQFHIDLFFLNGVLSFYFFFYKTALHRAIQTKSYDVVYFLSMIDAVDKKVKDNAV